MGQHRQICEYLEVRCLRLGGYRAESLKGWMGWNTKQEAAHPVLSLYPALHKVGEHRDFK